MGTPPQRLDVLFITHNFPRHPGDFAGRFLERLAGLLVARGVRVGAVAPHAPGAAEEETISGIPIWRFRYAEDSDEVLAYQGQALAPSLIGNRGLWAHRRYFASFKRLSDRIRRDFSPRVLHAHWWIPGGWVARGIVRKERLIVTSHGTDVRLLERKAWMRPFARRVYGRADLITVVSSSMADALQRAIPSVSSRLKVAPMPPEDGIFNGRVRESVNPTPLILCVTRHTAQKRNDILVKALARLRNDGVAFQCRIVGDGGSERESIVRLISQTGLESTVTLVPSMPQDRLAEEYRKADVTVLPAVDEGFGLALVEAQLCGCAVVGARSGGITDIITHEQTGLLVPPDDADELAKSLRQLLADNDLRRRLAQEGQRFAQTHFSSRAIVDRFLEWYQLG